MKEGRVIVCRLLHFRKYVYNRISVKTHICDIVRDPLNKLIHFSTKIPTLCISQGVYGLNRIEFRCITIVYCDHCYGGCCRRSSMVLLFRLVIYFGYLVIKLCGNESLKK